MFTAINATTGELINSLYCNFNEEFYRNEKWYADPLYLKDVPETIDRSKIEVRFRKGSNDILTSSGEVYDRSPHFFIVNSTELGIKTHSDSVEHKRCVKFIYDLLHNNNLKLVISSTKYGKNIIEISRNDLDLNRIGIEIVVKQRGFKRADILLQLKEFNQITGFGLILEVQLTNQSLDLELKRSFQRSSMGYSVCWISEEDLDEVVKNKEILIQSYGDIMDNYFEHYVKKIKEMTINYAKMMDQKKEEIEELYKNREPPYVIKCNKCPSDMIWQKTKTWKFYKCQSCQNIIWVSKI